MLFTQIALFVYKYLMSEDGESERDKSGRENKELFR